MPPITHFSKRFFDQLGDDVARELVEWCDSVEATYRADLRDLNSSIARLDAKLEQRLADLRIEVFREIAALRVDMSQIERSLIRWSFGFWIGAWFAIIGSLIALGQLGLLVPR
jgi:hypothetical protein